MREFGCGLVAVGTTYRPSEGCEGDADDLVEDERFGQVRGSQPLLEEIIFDFSHPSSGIALPSDDGERRCEEEGCEEPNPCRRPRGAVVALPCSPRFDASAGSESSVVGALGSLEVTIGVRS